MALCTKVTRKYHSVTTTLAHVPLIGDSTSVTTSDGVETNDTCDELECPDGAKMDCKKLGETKSQYQTKTHTDSKEQKKKYKHDYGAEWESDTVTDYDETIEIFDCKCTGGGETTEPKKKKKKDGGGGGKDKGDDGAEKKKFKKKPVKKLKRRQS